MPKVVQINIIANILKSYKSMYELLIKIPRTDTQI